jgi:hypothetical protein
MLDAMAEKEDFVELMLKKSRETKPTQPQSRTGDVDQKTAEKTLKEIQEKLQKK